MDYEKVLENFSWGFGKFWKSPGFFVSKRVGTLFIESVVFTRWRHSSLGVGLPCPITSCCK